MMDVNKEKGCLRESGAGKRMPADVAVYNVKGNEIAQRVSILGEDSLFPVTDEVMKNKDRFKTTTFFLNAIFVEHGATLLNIVLTLLLQDAAIAQKLTMHRTIVPTETISDARIAIYHAPLSTEDAQNSKRIGYGLLVKIIMLHLDTAPCILQQQLQCTRHLSPSATSCPNVRTSSTQFLHVDQFERRLDEVCNRLFTMIQARLTEAITTLKRKISPLLNNLDNLPNLLSSCIPLADNCARKRVGNSDLDTQSFKNKP
ncbi:hypothetical protein ACOME3_007123 [Neoechinorhynchus agilis]